MKYAMNHNFQLRSLSLSKCNFQLSTNEILNSSIYETKHKVRNNSQLSKNGLFNKPKKITSFDTSRYLKYISTKPETK